MPDAAMSPPAPSAPASPPRFVRMLRAWHRRVVRDGVDRAAVMARVRGEAGWSSRYVFMATMSAGIAILGLLLSSPAVIIGAMLVSPLMGPIIGLGFALATFDWPEVRKSLIALLLGTLLAVAFTALVVRLSPLQDITPEILARTRPNLFDLLVAIFSALAGAYATVRGRGETIVGVAIATALMPPLAVVGFGLATSNMPIFLGAFALYATNFIAIALSAAAVARFYGFGSGLSPRQSQRQAIALVIVLAVLAVPLAVSLRQIAWEAWATRTARNAVEAEFGEGSRVAGFDPNFAGETVRIRVSVFTDRFREKAATDLERSLSRTLGRPVQLRLSQVLVNDGSQRAELERARSAVAEARSDRLAQADLAARLAYLTGAPPEAITIDPVARRAVVRMDAAQDLSSLRQLEQRAIDDDPDWDIRLVPMLQPLPPLLFAEDSSAVDADVEDRLLSALWALDRWGVRQITVAGGRDSTEAARLAAARAEAVVPLLQACGLRAELIAPLPVDRAAEAERGRAAARAVRLTPRLSDVEGSGPAPETADLPPCPRASMQVPPGAQPPEAGQKAEAPAAAA